MKKLKYKNKPVYGYKSCKNSDTLFKYGRLWDSGGECRRYAQLLLLEKAGEIQDIECQPTVHLTRARISYRADFVYTERGRTVFEEFKGVRTQRFNLIAHLWKYYGPALLRIIGRKGDRFIVTQEIMPIMRG